MNWKFWRKKKNWEQPSKEDKWENYITPQKLTSQEKETLKKWHDNQPEELRPLIPPFPLLEEMVQMAKAVIKKEFGPEPPCLICGKESTKLVVPQPLQVKRIDHLLEDLTREQIFTYCFPLGATFCGDHTDEEIMTFIKKRTGVEGK